MQSLRASAKRSQRSRQSAQTSIKLTKRESPQSAIRRETLGLDARKRAPKTPINAARLVKPQGKPKGDWKRQRKILSYAPRLQ